MTHRGTGAGVSEVHAKRFAVLKALTLLVMAFFGITISLLFVGLMDHLGVFQDSFRYTPLVYVLSVFFGGGLVMMGVSVLLKWLLLGKVRPSIIVESYWRQWRVWCVDSFAQMPMWILSPWLQRTPLFNLWFWALGMRIPILTCSIPPNVVKLSSADLVSFDHDVFASDFVVKTKGDPPQEIAMQSGSQPGAWIAMAHTHFGAHTGVGLSSVCGPGVLCGNHSLVGAVTRVGPDVDYPGGMTISGNPAQALDRGSDGTEMGTELSGADVDDELVENTCGEDSVPRQILSSLWGFLIRVLLAALFVFVATIPAYEVLIALCDDVCYRGSLAEHTAMGLLAFAVTLLALKLGWLAAFLLLDAVHRLVVLRGHPSKRAYAAKSCRGVWIIEEGVVSEVVRKICVNPLLDGTAFLAHLHRLMGAKIGNNVYLTGVVFTDVDNLQIGDDSVIDNSDCGGHRQTSDTLAMAPVIVGSRCTLQPGSLLLNGDRMEDDVLVGPRTKSTPGQILRCGLHWHGAPARGYVVDRRHDASEANSD